MSAGVAGCCWDEQTITDASTSADPMAAPRDTLFEKPVALGGGGGV